MKEDIMLRRKAYDRMLASLDRFKGRFGKRIGSEIVLHARQLRVEGDRLYLPLYMAGLL